MSLLSVKLESILLPLVYRNEPLQKLITMSAEFLGTPIRFAPENNPDFSIVSPGFPQEDIQHIRNVLAGDLQGYNTYLYVISKNLTKTPIILEKKNGAPFDKLFCNVIIGDRYFGNLTIPEVHVSVRELDLDVVGVICNAIALSCAISGQWGYNRNNANVFLMLLQERVTTHAQIADLTTEWRQYQKKCWRLVTGILPKGVDTALFTSGVERIFSDNLITWYQNTINVLVDVTGRDVTEKQKQQLEKYAKVTHGTFCVGMPFEEVLNCKKEWSSIMDHPKMRVAAGDVVIYYEKNPEYALFYQCGLSYEELSRFQDPRIGMIAKYDRQHNTEYLKTLKAVLTANGDPHAASVQLATHKNTVLYRIRRMNELFQVDVADLNTVFQLMLTLKLQEYSQIQ